MLVGERRERNGRKLAAFEPVHSSGIDSDSFLRADVRAVLEVRVLPFLLRFEVQPCDRGESCTIKENSKLTYE